MKDREKGKRKNYATPRTHAHACAQRSGPNSKKHRILWEEQGLVSVRNAVYSVEEKNIFSECSICLTFISVVSRALARTFCAYLGSCLLHKMGNK